VWDTAILDQPENIASYESVPQDIGLGDTVRISRVLHGAQQWPDEMPDRPPVELA
jgi:plasmid stabilization system protein ParE